MAKGKKTVYFCQNCGHEETKWLGQCPACREWNTFVEEKITTAKTAAVKSQKEAQVLALSEVRTDDQVRLMTGLDELDRVLGGGIVPGSLVLVGGGPGNRKIHPSSPGMPASVRGQTGAVCIRGRIPGPDQASGKPHGNVQRQLKASVRDQPGHHPKYH